MRHLANIRYGSSHEFSQQDLQLGFSTILKVLTIRRKLSSCPDVPAHKAFKPTQSTQNLKKDHNISLPLNSCENISKTIEDIDKFFKVC